MPLRHMSLPAQALHDLRAPLSAIIGVTSALLMQPAGLRVRRAAAPVTP